ncbi:G-type lectin S-receptor-like serine/threonine-protein kinase RLK1, partial [Ziziphus jujuba]|uniref:Receptor-like serine/threonine-protein kinase n=1 Tax=Ziziphus jujuba TaxID=326968 RepID=A0A6P3ZDX1_ZIZJJ
NITTQHLLPLRKTKPRLLSRTIIIKILVVSLAMAFSPGTLVVFSLFLLLLPLLSVFAQTNGSVPVGASLSALHLNSSSSWLSPSGDFAFGFRHLQNDLFLLSIWFNKIPDKTIVWHANEGRPVTRGSRVNLTANGGLILTDPQGQELWRSDLISGVVVSGNMSDDGNFALQGSNSDRLWQSFEIPTDTMLPTQTMVRGGVLYSRQSATNYSKGRFRLSLGQDGNLELYTVNLPTDNPNSYYYQSDTAASDSNSSVSPGSRLVFNQSGAIYVLRENGDRKVLKEQGGGEDNYLRATLDYDGIFTLYSHPKAGNSGGTWTTLWSVPGDICQDLLVDSGLGICGYNSICTLKEDRRPTCHCPTGYSLLDPSDIYGDCKPDFPQGCAEDQLSNSISEDLYKVEVLINTDWPLSDYTMLKPFTAEKCNQTCLQDCMCAVAIFRDGTCWKKKIPLANGRVDTSLNSQAFIKVRKDNSTDHLVPPNNPQKKEKDNDNLIVIGSVLFGSSVFINFVLLAAIFVGFFFIYRRKLKTTPRKTVQVNLSCFTYKELEEATNGFEEELGRGAFGIVYKGFLQIGSGIGLAVAVKKLNYVVEDTEREFKNEVNIIGQTHHKNLVRLLGYCDEGQHRLLVYEYLSNGTLAKYLFGEIKPAWNQRVEIAYGVARGLLYLHEECSSQIIHCDIKPQNILLDEKNMARISDFGLSKLLKMDQSHTHTAIRGTKGYVAPEWFRNMPITAKVDVYGFGVVLLEIICCRKSVESENQSGEEKGILTDWAYDCYQEGALDMLVNCDEHIENKKKLKAFVMVALWCIQENPNLRPTMKKVVQMLEGVVEVLDPPCPFPYSISTTIPSQKIQSYEV